MMKSNPADEGQIKKKKIYVIEEENTLVSPRAFSKSFSLKGF